MSPHVSRTLAAPVRLPRMPCRWTERIFRTLRLYIVSTCTKHRIARIFLLRRHRCLASYWGPHCVDSWCLRLSLGRLFICLLSGFSDSYQWKTGIGGRCLVSIVLSDKGQD